MPVVLTEVSDGVGVVTLNRPEARNALSRELIAAIPDAMAAMEADGAVEVVVLTGADPAFCAGLDLGELGSAGLPASPAAPRFWHPMTKPVIGAVNGPAVTGGFELALQCDFLVASERARFGDTHARVGVVPAGGMSVLLPQAVGVRKAMQLSLTGTFLDAHEARAWGLVVDVVAHDELLPAVRAMAAEIAANDRVAVRTMLDEYKRTAETTIAGGWEVERDVARGFYRERFDPAAVEQRREAVIEKGRRQSR